MVRLGKQADRPRPFLDDVELKTNRRRLPPPRSGTMARERRSTARTPAAAAAGGSAYRNNHGWAHGSIDTRQAAGRYGMRAAQAPGQNSCGVRRARERRCPPTMTHTYRHHTPHPAHLIWVARLILRFMISLMFIDDDELTHAYSWRQDIAHHDTDRQMRLIH